jgi:hypothetical protein
MAALAGAQRDVHGRERGRARTREGKGGGRRGVRQCLQEVVSAFDGKQDVACCKLGLSHAAA